MITDLRLQNFRSYGDDSFEFNDGVTIIVGPNASGKTNLLEGLLVACQGSSYRAKDNELIMHAKDWARMDIHTLDESRAVIIKDSGVTSVEKTFSINTQLFKRLQSTKKIPVVLFEPDHLQLLSAGPEKRRDFIDNQIEKITAGYNQTRRDYKRALSQRNRLLKNSLAPTPAELFAWDVRLSELGGKIVQHRTRLVDTINQSLETVYSQLAGYKQTVQAKYATKLFIPGYTQQMLSRLQKNLSIDRERGFTAAGPHREDIEFYLQHKNASAAASRGETRTLLLALKIIELKLLEDRLQKRPILLLDDVFSELDGARRKALTSFLKDYQTFITTTEADVVVQHFIGECTIIPTKS